MSASTVPEPSAGRPSAQRTGQWRTRIEVEEPQSRVAVAIGQDGTTIGLATAGALRDDDAATSWELYSINVVPEQQGGGVADDLIWLTAGERDCTVWVLTENARAQAFYRRHGFQVEGARRVHQGSGAAEMRMVRRSAHR